MLFIPFSKYFHDNQEEYLDLMPTKPADFIRDNIYFPIILNFSAILLSLLSIFKYKKRILQYKLVNLLVLLNVLITGLLFLLSYVKDGTIGEIHFSIGAFFPIISIFSAFFAAHYIKKDEQLVRNSDRIR